MSYHFSNLPTATDQTRADGWSPALQRRFLEILAATGVVRLAADSCRITARSAYNLRNRRDGAAFRLGWDAAILIARARLADDLLERAIMGCTEIIRRDEENFEVTRHRHDNRLAMSMLARLDRMADSPAQGTDAALARVVSQDFVAYLDMICPPDRAAAEAERAGLPAPGAEAGARGMADAVLIDGATPMDIPLDVEEAAGDAAAILSPGAAAALFVAIRVAAATAGTPQLSAPQGRCELRPGSAGDLHVDLSELPPQEAAARLRGIWWDDEKAAFLTDYPAPAGFEGYESDDIYD
ncbi:MAG: hypothetical protein ABW048_02345, partial [Sphingobium sp.]